MVSGRRLLTLLAPLQT